MIEDDVFKKLKRPNLMEMMELAVEVNSALKDKSNQACENIFIVNGWTSKEVMDEFKKHYTLSDIPLLRSKGIL
jgi:hypothetical protein